MWKQISKYRFVQNTTEKKTYLHANELIYDAYMYVVVATVVEVFKV